MLRKSVDDKLAVRPRGLAVKSYVVPAKVLRQTLGRPLPNFRNMQQFVITVFDRS